MPARYAVLMGLLDPAASGQRISRAVSPRMDGECHEVSWAEGAAFGSGAISGRLLPFSAVAAKI